MSCPRPRRKSQQSQQSLWGAWSENKTKHLSPPEGLLSFPAQPVLAGLSSHYRRRAWSCSVSSDQEFSYMIFFRCPSVLMSFWRFCYFSASMFWTYPRLLNLVLAFCETNCGGGDPRRWICSPGRHLTRDPAALLSSTILRTLCLYRRLGRDWGQTTVLCNSLWFSS